MPPLPNSLQGSCSQQHHTSCPLPIQAIVQAAYWTGPAAEYQPMLVSQMVDAFWESEPGAALHKRLQSEPERSEEGEQAGLEEMSACNMCS